MVVVVLFFFCYHFCFFGFLQSQFLVGFFWHYFLSRFSMFFFLFFAISVWDFG